MCGGDLSNSPGANSFEISHQHVAQHQTAQHTEEQDGWDPERDGQTSGSTNPPLTPLVSSSSSSMMVCATQPSNSLISWVLIEFYDDHQN
jgi:hypothetical protein